VGMPIIIFIIIIIIIIIINTPGMIKSMINISYQQKSYMSKCTHLSKIAARDALNPSTLPKTLISATAPQLQVATPEIDISMYLIL